MTNYNGFIEVSVSEDGEINAPAVPEDGDIIFIWTTEGYKPKFAEDIEECEWLNKYLDEDGALR